MGTSARMIERHYGALLAGSHAGIADRKAGFEQAQERAAEMTAEEGLR